MSISIAPLKFGLLLSPMLVLGTIATSTSFNASAQKINPDGSLPSCKASEDMIFGSKGWIYEPWEWNSSFQFTAVDEIKDMNDIFKKRGLNLFMVPVPARTVKYSNYVDLSKYSNVRFSVFEYKSNWNKMIDDVSNLGVNIVNILPTVEKYNVGSRGEAFYYPRDHHWTTSGSEASSKVVTDAINKMVRSKNSAARPVFGTLKVIKLGFNSGSFGDHYAAKCKNITPRMDAYKATNTPQQSSLLGDKKPNLAIFGDSFGLAAPDNNFSVFIEHYTGLRTINYSTPGIGPFGALVGYLADPKISQQLPSVVVVPIMGSMPNDPVLYRQVTAEVAGCHDKIKESFKSFKSDSNIYKYTPTDLAQAAWSSVHLMLDKDVQKVNMDIHYENNFSEKVSLVRDSNEYYKGDKRNFFIAFQKDKKIDSIDISIDNSTNFSGSIEICKIF